MCCVRRHYSNNMHFCLTWFTRIVNAHEVEVFIVEDIVDEMQDGGWRVDDERVTMTHWRHECASEHDAVQSLYRHKVGTVVQTKICGSSLQRRWHIERSELSRRRKSTILSSLVGFYLVGPVWFVCKVVVRIVPVLNISSTNSRSSRPSEPPDISFVIVKAVPVRWNFDLIFSTGLKRVCRFSFWAKSRSGTETVASVWPITLRALYMEAVLQTLLKGLSYHSSCKH